MCVPCCVPRREKTRCIADDADRERMLCAKGLEVVAEEDGAGLGKGAGVCPSVSRAEIVQTSLLFFFITLKPRVE